MRSSLDLFAATGAGVGKSELCGILNWSRPTLDRRLARDPTFPVHARGTAAGGWCFDVAAVTAHLQAQRAATDGPRPVGKKELCGHLGWSRPRLDRHLAQDDEFPVRARGTRGGGWTFDVKAVEAHLKRRRLEALEASAQRGLVGKRDLAHHLGWSRPRLDRHLTRDATFPVAMRGSKSGGWAFDVAAVDAHLKRARRHAVPGPAEEPPARGSGNIRAEHVGEASAKERRDTAQAMLAEDRLRLRRGELVEAETARTQFAEAIDRIRRELEALPDRIGAELGLPESDSDRIRSVIDQARRSFVAGLHAHELFQPD